MTGPVNQRFVITVLDDLRGAMNAARQLVENELEPQTISVIGQEASFANEQENVRQLNAILSRETNTSNLNKGSDKIISLVHNPCAPVPKTIAENGEDFGRMLRRWLIPQHARRLSKAIDSGQFLLLAELRSMVEERIAARCLLRNNGRTVEVHDFPQAPGEKEMQP